MEFLPSLWTVRKKPSPDPLRIGIDARLAYHRGVGTYAANLIIALSKTDPRNEYSLFNAPPLLKEKVQNRNFQWVDLPPKNPAYYEQIQLPRAARERKLDFLHYVDNTATLFDPFPYVLTLHDVMHERPLRDVRVKPTLRQRFLHLYKKWFTPRSALKAKAIITISEYSKRSIVEKIGLPSGKIHVIPEGVDQELFVYTRRKHSKIFKILVQGATDERKNLANILKAARILKGQGKLFQLVVIGMDLGDLKQSHCLDQTIEMELGPQVEWVGNVPFDVLKEIYSGVDLFLYPSKIEGFGLPLLEAFACGVPVITSNRTALPETAGEAALLVDPESPESISEAVKQIMEKPSLRKRLVEKGLKRAEEFSWERTARLTRKVYEGIVP